MTIRLIFALLVIFLPGQVHAFCIVNQSQSAVAYVRGGPFAGMETYFAGEVRPGGQRCTRITSRMDGTFPVSVYSISQSGRCAIIRGCFYETEAEQVFYKGAASSSCPVAFRDNTCN